MQGSTTSSELPEGKEVHRKAQTSFFLPINSFFFSNCCHASDSSMKRQGGKYQKLFTFMDLYNLSAKYAGLFLKHFTVRETRTRELKQINAEGEGLPNPSSTFSVQMFILQKCNSTRTVQTSRVSDLLSIDVSVPSVQQ